MVGYVINFISLLFVIIYIMVIIFNDFIVGVSVDWIVDGLVNMIC